MDKANDREGKRAANGSDRGAFKAAPIDSAPIDSTRIDSMRINSGSIDRASVDPADIGRAYDGPAAVDLAPIVHLQAMVQEIIETTDTLSGAQASSALRQVALLAAMVDALRVRLVSVVAKSRVWLELDPNATAASFLRHELGLDQRQASADLRAAECLEAFPQLASAAAEGTISRDKVDLIIAVGLRTRPRAAVFSDFVDVFVSLAQRLTIGQLRKALQMWADQIDPVTTSADDSSAHDRRALHVSQLGDGVKLDGFFGPEQGLKILAALNGALDAHHYNATQETNNRSGTNNSTHADGAPDRDADDTSDDAATDDASTAPPGWGADGDRTRIAATARQRADAFIESIIDPILAGGLLPTCGGAPTTINVTVPIQRLAHPDQALPADAVAQYLKTSTGHLASAIGAASNGPGEFVLGADTANRLACDATIRRVLITPQGMPLDIGRRTRVIPEHLRAALVVRDGGCRYPFCDRPAAWTEGHHIEHWSKGGPTSLSNLILLCSRHHHKIHADKIPIAPDHHGIPRVVLPTSHPPPKRE